MSCPLTSGKRSSCACCCLTSIGSIVHVVEVTTATRPDGSTETTRSETWHQTSGPDGGAEERLLDSMRGLVTSGRAHEEGGTTVDGRTGIRIVSDFDDRSLVVDAETYRPLEWTLTADDGTKSSTRIESYETLPPTVANLTLTSVRAQHPDAPVDASGAVTNEPGMQPKG